MRFLTIGVLAAIGAFMPTTTQAKPSVVVTLSSVGDRVRSQNPELAAARWHIREAMARAEQAGLLSNPELEIAVDTNTRLGEAAGAVGIFQKFPVTDRLRLEKQLSVSKLEAAAAEVGDVERKLVASGRAALVEVLAIRQRRSLLKQQAELTGELAATIQKSVEVGEGSALDAGRARVEALRVVAEARQFDAREAEALGRLKPLLGIRLSENLIVSGSLPEVSLPGSSVNPERRPDYQVSRIDVESAKREVALEEARRYEDIEAGVFMAIAREEDAPVGFENETTVGLSFRIPLPLWNKNEGRIEEARAMHQRRILEAEALGREIQLEADAALAEMHEWAGLVSEIGNNLLPLAEEQAKLAETAWHNGQSDIQSVLEARERSLELAGLRLEALRDFHLAKVRYLAAIGSN